MGFVENYGLSEDVKGGPQNRGLFNRKLEFGNLGDSNAKCMQCKKHLSIHINHRNSMKFNEIMKYTYKQVL